MSITVRETDIYKGIASKNIPPVITRKIYLDTSELDESSTIKTDNETIPTSVYSNNTAISNVTIANLELEKMIFLRAALKMIDQREFSKSQHQFQYQQRQLKGIGGISKSTNNNFNLDAIRTGKLKKLSSTHVGSHIWKQKNVRLQHGFMYYSDYSDISTDANTKCIKLDIETCLCRPQKGSTKKFEIVTHSSGESSNNNEDQLLLRVWKTTSEEERNSWVETICSLMTGSAGDFVRVGGGNSSLLGNNVVVGGTGEDMSESSHGGGTGMDSSISPNSGLGLATHVFLDYTDDIKIFNHVMQSVLASASIMDYKSTLMSTVDRRFVVPVEYIKNKAGNQSLTFSKSLQDLSYINEGNNSDMPRTPKSGRKLFSRSHSGSIGVNNSFSTRTGSQEPQFVPIQSSQAWKDLHRDVLLVNGELISGEMGPEVIVGALARHIYSTVQEMKSRRNGESSAAGSSAYDATDLDESAILSCARQVLLSCNRTQSGGDTYYCVESLLCNRDYAVLTPLTSNADPMEIFVDIVETKHDDSTTTDVGRGSFRSNSVHNADDLADSAVPSGMIRGAAPLLSSLPIKNTSSVSDTDLDSESAGTGASGGSGYLLPNKDGRPRSTSSLRHNSIDLGAGEAAMMNEPGHHRSRSLPIYVEDIANITDPLIESNPPPQFNGAANKKVQYTNKELPNITSPSNDDNTTAQVSDLTNESNESNQSLNLFKFAKKSLSSFSPFKNINHSEDSQKQLNEITNANDPLIHRHLKLNESKLNAASQKKISLSKQISNVLWRKKGKDEETDSATVGFSHSSDYCVRIQIVAKSRYRLCNLDPQNESEDTYAVISGYFQQFFFLKFNCGGKPSVSDRLVAICVDKVCK